MDEEFKSMFKTRVNEEHFMTQQKKTSKLNKEMREAAFFAALEQHADTTMMRAQRGKILWNVYR